MGTLRIEQSMDAVSRQRHVTAEIAEGMECLEANAKTSKPNLEISF